MRLLVAAILTLCAVFIHPSFAVRDFKISHVSRTAVPDRLNTMMRNLYVSGIERVSRLLPKRVEYEKSVEFEEGYILGEIIERYRQLVLHLKVSLKFKNLKVYDLLIRLEFMQKLYFEIYHLVKMMHEIPRKYGADESDIKTEHTYKYVSLAQKARQKKEVKLKQARQLQKLHQKMSNKGFVNSSELSMLEKILEEKKKKKKWWPLDYGWSIEDW